MLHFSDALIICSPFFSFVPLVALTEGGIPVTLREGLNKYPYIKVCTVLVTSPKIICCDI